MQVELNLIRLFPLIAAIPHRHQAILNRHKMESLLCLTAKDCIRIRPWQPTNLNGSLFYLLCRWNYAPHDQRLILSIIEEVSVAFRKPAVQAWTVLQLIRKELPFLVLDHNWIFWLLGISRTYLNGAMSKNLLSTFLEANIHPFPRNSIQAFEHHFWKLKTGQFS